MFDPRSQLGRPPKEVLYGSDPEGDPVWIGSGRDPREVMDGSFRSTDDVRHVVPSYRPES